VSEQNAPLPDGGPTDGEHEGEQVPNGQAPEKNQADGEVDRAPEDGADTTEEGVLSPGSTASGSPTSLGE
jgi:hypothetical protein